VRRLLAAARTAGAAPSVLLAYVAAATVLGLAAAATAPFLAVAGNAAVTTELDRAGPEAAGLRFGAVGSIDPDDLAVLEQAVADALRDRAELQTVLRADPATAQVGGTELSTRAVAVPDPARDLVLVSGSADDLGPVVDGAVPVLVPVPFADDTGVEVGDTFELRRGDRTLVAAVVGTYAPLDPVTAPPQLEELADLATAREGATTRTADLLVLDRRAVAASAAQLRGQVTGAFAIPAPEGVTSLTEARRLRGSYARLASQLEDDRSTIGELAGRLGRAGPEGVTLGLRVIVRDADAAVAALAGPVRAVSIAGQAIALLVVGAAALFAARRRERVLRLAAVRGRGPLAEGGRAAVAALPGLVVGVILGWALALGLVLTFGPPGEVPDGTATDAAVAVATVLLPALVLVVGVTGVVLLRTVQVGRRRRRLAAAASFPWEAVVLALGIVGLVQLRLGGGVAVAAGSPRLDPLVLLVPVLLLVGGVGLLARLARRWLPRLRRVGGDGPAAVFLALRRLAAPTSQALLLTAATAVTLGLVVYTAALSTSLGTALDEKARVQAGADAVALADPATLDLEAADGTHVQRLRARLVPSQRSVDLLLVDPATFASATGWADQLVGASVASLVAPLGEADATLPVLLVGATRDGDTLLEVPGLEASVEVVGSPPAFPGLSPTRPLVVASLPAATALAAEQGGGTPRTLWNPVDQVWASGSGAAGRLEAAGAPPDRILTAAEQAEQPRLVAVTYALGALQAFAVLATVLALAGILLFVAARQRATQVSYALARRMGLGTGAHRRALRVEVLALLTGALVVAAVLGLAAALLVVTGLDPLPDLPPAPRGGIPGLALTALVATLALVGFLGAAGLQRTADRADVAEVLRGT
jgi:putative ABC transport system permease protein